MVISPEAVATVATAPFQLAQAAAAYDDAAARLNSVLAKVPPYLEQIDHAEQVNWESMASDSFRAVLQSLRLPGHLMIGELSALAGQAASIAADLHHYAQLAQNVVALLSSVSLPVLAAETAWGMASDTLQTAWQEATSALESGAEVFVDYIDRNGGVPQILQEAAGSFRPW